MLSSKTYDFIFIGAGCASLSLLMRMLKSSELREKKFLLIEKEPKTHNDRTWCFWEKQAGFFEEIVYKKWDHLSFLSDKHTSTMDIAPYQYKMIRGVDFYNYCFNEIRKHPNVEVVYGEVKRMNYNRDSVVLHLNNQEIMLWGENRHVFDSIYKPTETNGKTIRLLQHFKGWVIETKMPAFNPSEAILMDFRVHQDHGTSFAYVLPFSETSALVEYTLFTKELLSQLQYDKELKNYIQVTLGIKEFMVKEEEFGVIPMTNEKLSLAGGCKWGWNIGTAGGQTKASTGYTFQFIQKQSEQIIDNLLTIKNLNRVPDKPARFRFYDNTLLHILYHNQLPGKEIFTRLFQKNKPQQVLRFLDNESSFGEELKIISTLPTWPFLKAAIRQL